ncbi:hypothetical protein [Paraburkholderia terricola]|uniref:hypothetical protein n=1 Tax=Paraburkholderia terricola TaxID=169427 RepID=UPI0012603026|nr:hypothetical protein [Paraburkholderia terricola]
MVEKIGLWGSAASIVSLALYFYPPVAASQNEPKVQVSTAGTESPAIGTNQGNVTINYGSSAAPHEKGYVLRNRSAGASLVVSRPTLDAATVPALQVCVAPAGTPISLYGETAKMAGLDMWQKVKILSGQCANKVGWATTENISFE